MILTDSHCHLDCLHYSGDDNLAQVIQRAGQVGVKYFLCVCITQGDFEKMLAFVQDYANIFVSVGTHPNEPSSLEPSVEEMVHLALHPKVVAIGETGLDYYRTEADCAWQKNRFRNHIQAALETNKPLIVHSRQARADTLAILKETKAPEVGGVMHCFSEDWDMARQALDLNFYISFSGIVTFKNAVELQEVVKKVPLDRILIETDAPYLAPVPFRGKSNEPAYVQYVAEKIAEIKGETIEKVAEQTTQNFFKLFQHAKCDETTFF